ncbi:putative salicylate hydroxylase [Plenodomus tracheiphilus IPT5]|uniref:Salicylate hydroxylase n=1 Tax=Plenodomus tracheiphilus IPT5 TaxID=1408161 RepID=A0A6A7AUZ8_9PLEO|nr:putative salicylate hydroxylase [Plenodomus tracheiphilus IPT5]
MDSLENEFNNGTGLALNIGVVGAGIAGLTAAAVLIHLGHNVELFERSNFSNEVGAAINVGPNAAPVLKAIGFDFTGARLMEALGGIQYDSKTLEELYRGSFDHFESRFGAPLYLAHRVDLHNELKRLALAPTGITRRAKLNLSTPVIGIDCVNGVLQFEDGSSVRKDVIVGADGVHSIIAKAVLGTEIPGTEVGECAYRFLIPTEALRQNPLTRELFRDPKCSFNIASAPDRRLVWYPCRNGELQNFVGLHPAKDDRIESESWTASGSVQDLLETFSDFHPALLEICRNAEDPKLWKLIFRSPIRQWTKGKVIIIGDAAHPMLPHQGQGGGQGIEDAGALGIFLANVQNLEDIPARLELVQNTRRNRAGAMQIFSNAGQDEAVRIQKDAQPYVNGPVPKNQAEFQEWNFAYNILDECRAVLAKS